MWKSGGYFFLFMLITRPITVANSEQNRNSASHVTNIGIPSSINIEEGKKKLDTSSKKRKQPPPSYGGVQGLISELASQYPQAVL